MNFIFDLRMSLGVDLRFLNCLLEFKRLSLVWIMHVGVGVYQLVWIKRWLDRGEFLLHAEGRKTVYFFSEILMRDIQLHQTTLLLLFIPTSHRVKDLVGLDFWRRDSLHADRMKFFWWLGWFFNEILGRWFWFLLLKRVHVLFMLFLPK